MNEISTIKADLAREDVNIEARTLEKAILLPTNFSHSVENPRAETQYPEIKTMLFHNPFEVKKKKKKKGKKKKR